MKSIGWLTSMKLKHCLHKIAGSPNSDRNSNNLANALADDPAIGYVSDARGGLGRRDMPSHMRHILGRGHAITQPQLAKPAPGPPAIGRNLFVAAGAALIIDAAWQGVGDAEAASPAFQLPGDNSNYPVAGAKLSGGFQNPNIARLGVFDIDGTVQGHGWLGKCRGS